MEKESFSAKLMAILAASLFVFSYQGSDAFATVDDTSLPNPPGGYANLCSPESIKVIPRPTSRGYSAQATCWINIGDTTNADKQQWVQKKLTMEGRYFMKEQKFKEVISSKEIQGSTTIEGSCNDDPWATKASCQVSAFGNAITKLDGLYGWAFAPGQIGVQPGPMTRILFDPNLVQAQLKNTESKPPMAPAGVDAVRLPENGGKSALGKINWRASDMSDNKFVLQFDIEYAKKFADSTYSKAGQRVGPGPKQNISSSEANLVYVFTTPFALDTGVEYFFRVCAVNDAGRRCSAPVQARQPTFTETAGVKSAGPKALAGSITPPAGGNRPPVSGGPQQSGGTPPAGGNPPGNVPGGTAPGIAGKRGVTIAGNAPTGVGSPAGSGGTTPGQPSSGTQPAAKPDLAVAPEGMMVNDRPAVWNSNERLMLHPDMMSHSCPVKVSSRYTNIGKGPATNVVAEIRNSQQPMQPIATANSPSLAPGQFGVINGNAVVKAAPTGMGTKLVLTVSVRENGSNLDTNLSNNRGTVTLDIICK